MINTKEIIFGTVFLIAVAQCSHVIQKRDLELPEDDDLVEIGRLEELNDKVLQKRSEHHEHGLTSDKYKKLSSLEKSNPITASEISDISSRDSARKHHIHHHQGSTEHHEKRTKTVFKSKTHKNSKKYTIPAAFAAWKQQFQPVYVASRFTAGNPAQARTVMNAQQYYNYQRRRIAMSNAARLAALQAYQRSGRIPPKALQASYNQRLQSPGKMSYGTINSKFPPGGIGKLPQSQQSLNQGKNKQVSTKGSPISKVLAPLNQYDVKKLPLNGKANQEKADSTNHAPVEDKKEKEKENREKESKSAYKLKKSKARRVKAAQRARIDDDDNTEESDSEEGTDSKANNENNATEDNGDENNADAENEDNLDDDDSSDQSDGKNSDENNDEGQLDSDNQGDNGENDDSNNADGDTDDDGGEGENDSNTSGSSRSSIEQNQDRSEDDQQKEDTESQEDGERDDENSEGEIIASPDEAPQLQQEVDGPVDPANSPARDTGDENTPPAPEETYTSRSSIDDYVGSLQ